MKVYIADIARLKNDKDCWSLESALGKMREASDRPKGEVTDVLACDYCCGCHVKVQKKSLERTTFVRFAVAKLSHRDSGSQLALSRDICPTHITCDRPLPLLTIPLKLSSHSTAPYSAKFPH